MRTLKTCALALLINAVSLGTVALAIEAPEHTVNSFENSIGMKMVRIPAGEFVMGSGKTGPRTNREFVKREWDEAPEHKVFISKEFYMGAFEVTNAEYEKFDPQHKKLRGNAGVWRMKINVSVADDEPVTFVTYGQAVKFCAWLSKKEGKPYRLPTEAEWEYACRAETTTAFSTGDSINSESANLGSVRTKNPKQSFTKPVGNYPPNDFNLYDMHGNVAEWCLDWYGPYTAAEKKDPVGRATGYSRVARGGCYDIFRSAAQMKKNNKWKYIRSANRAGYLPIDANRQLGFRVVQAVMPKTKALPEVKPLCMQNVKQNRPKKHQRHKQPYFFDFSKARKNPSQKGNLGPFFSNCHYTNMIACPNGDMLAVWNTGGEYAKNAPMAASRLVYGTDTWQPASILFKVPDVNYMAGTVLSDGESIYLFAPMALAGFRDASIAMRESKDNGATWGQPRFVYPRVGDKQVSPWFLQEVLTSAVGPRGELMFEAEIYQKHWGFFISKDKGKTWKVNGVCRDGYHATLHIGKSGKWTAYVRAGRGITMPRWESSDEGKTWTKGEPTPFPKAGIGNKLKVLNLSSGATLLVTADRFKPTLSGGKYGCALVALSFDDGKTWPHVRSVPIGGGLSAAQNLDGLIYVFAGRRNVVTFNEAWVKQGKSAAQLTTEREAKVKLKATSK
jgi:formylglycine-generating enzyme required for sulfatase activity